MNNETDTVYIAALENRWLHVWELALCARDAMRLAITTDLYQGTQTCLLCHSIELGLETPINHSSDCPLVLIEDGLNNPRLTAAEMKVVESRFHRSEKI